MSFNTKYWQIPNGAKAFSPSRRYMEMEWSCIRGSSDWKLGKGVVSPLTGFPGQWSQLRASQSSSSVWTMLLVIWLILGSSARRRELGLDDSYGSLPEWDILWYLIWNPTPKNGHSKEEKPSKQKQRCLVPYHLQLWGCRCSMAHSKNTESLENLCHGFGVFQTFLPFSPDLLYVLCTLNTTFKSVYAKSVLC